MVTIASLKRKDTGRIVLKCVPWLRRESLGFCRGLLRKKNSIAYSSSVRRTFDMLERPWKFLIEQELLKLLRLRSCVGEP